MHSKEYHRSPLPTVEDAVVAVLLLNSGLLSPSDLTRRDVASSVETRVVQLLRHFDTRPVRRRGGTFGLAAALSVWDGYAAGNNLSDSGQNCGGPARDGRPSLSLATPKRHYASCRCELRCKTCGAVVKTPSTIYPSRLPTRLSLAPFIIIIYTQPTSQE